MQIRHLKPNILTSQQDGTISICPDPHSLPPRSTLFSLAKIFVWLIEEWYANLFLDKKEVLLICDRYYHDLLVDSKRYRYGGPRWAANLVGQLVQKPDLWVLLDAPAEILQSRKREVPFEESSRQRQEYLAFVRSQRNYVIIDASQSLDKVIVDAKRAIVHALTENKGNCG